VANSTPFFPISDFLTHTYAHQLEALAHLPRSPCDGALVLGAGSPLYPPEARKAYEALSLNYRAAADTL